MTKDKVRHLVEQAVNEWKDASETGIVHLSDNVRPVGGIGGFDSYSGIAATVHIEEQIGVDLSTDNVFLTPDGKRARRVDQIVEALYHATDSAVGIGHE